MRTTVSNKWLVLGMSAFLSMAATACKVDQSENKNQQQGTDGTDATDGTDGTDGESSKSFDDVQPGITTIGGLVLDNDTLQPIQGATITTDPPMAALITNANGEFVIDATDYPTLATQAQTVRVTANRTGYVSNSANITVVDGQFQQANVLLTKAAGEFNVEVSQTVLQFSDNDFNGGDTATKTLTVKLVDAPTAQSADYSIFIPAQFSWLSADPAAGSITGSPRFVNVTINRANLDNGAYSADLNLLVTGATALEPIQVLYNRNDASSSDGTDSTDGTDGTDSTDGSADGTDSTDGADATDAADGSGGAEGGDAQLPADQWYDEAQYDDAGYYDEQGDEYYEDEYYKDEQYDPAYDEEYYGDQGYGAYGE